MDRETYDRTLEQNAAKISEIKELAHKVHAAVNQHYDKVHPYGIHLDRVADKVSEYAHLVCDDTADVLPLIFGAYFHDSIEDARLTYNNVHHLALKMMDERQARLAAEIVYALTNEKGRTRAERANDRYYQGIRTTPYAPVCKIADRIANVSYSAVHTSSRSTAMRSVYAQENPHFIASVTGGTTNPDKRMQVPAEMLNELKTLLEK